MAPVSRHTRRLLSPQSSQELRHLLESARHMLRASLTVTCSRIITLRMWRLIRSMSRKESRQTSSSGASTKRLCMQHQNQTRLHLPTTIRWIAASTATTLTTLAALQKLPAIPPATPTSPTSSSTDPTCPRSSEPSALSATPTISTPSSSYQATLPNL